MGTRFIRYRIAVAFVALSAALHGPLVACADISVLFHLENAPASAAANIIDSMNAAIGVFNEWSDYNELVNVHYSNGVLTTEGGFDGVITFGPNTDFHTTSAAWREVLHTMGSGTFPGYNNFLSNGLWTGVQGIATSEYYYPGADLLANADIHSVDGHNSDLSRQGVHIMGAMREDMGLLNGNYLGELGDFNLSGSIGAGDYAILIANLHKDYTGQGRVAAFYNGDMNSDLLVNFYDFVAFRAIYDEAHGEGAFQRLQAVPEPAAWCLLLVGIVSLVASSRRTRPLSFRKGCEWRWQRVTNARPEIKQMSSRLATAIFFVAVCGIHAHAQRTYLDARITDVVGRRGGGPRNTRPIEAFLPGTNNGADDDLWTTIGDGSEGSVYQSGDGDGEDAPQIETTIGSLSPNALYSIYVHFWDAGTPWSIRAGLASGSLALYASPSDAIAIGAQPAVLASSLSYSGPSPLFAEADRTMYAGWLGTAKANSDGEIIAYIDDLPSTSGLDRRTWYDGLSFQLTTLETLTLRVNTSTGGLSIRNDAGTPVDMDYYEIRSATQALVVSAWNSLNDQDGNDQLGAGWDEAGGISASILSEVNQFGSTHFDPLDVAGLGNAFLQGAMNDLAFYYSVAGDSVLTPGYVEYVTNASLGDYNGNGHIDAADYTVWRNSLGAAGPNLPADGDGDMDVDHDDYVYWKNRYGQPIGSGAAASNEFNTPVPEPLNILSSVAAMIILFMQRRGHRKHV